MHYWETTCKYAGIERLPIYVIAMQGKIIEIHYHSGFIKKINFTVQYGTYSASQISKNKPTPNSCYF